MCGGSQCNLFGMLCAYKGILLLVGEDYVANKKTEEDVVNKEKQWLFAKLAKVLGAKNPIEADGWLDLSAKVW